MSKKNSWHFTTFKYFRKKESFKDH